MSMFPGAGAEVYRNEAGEPVGWDYPSDPSEDPGDPYDDYDPGYDPDEDDGWDDDEPPPDAHLEMEYELRTDIGDMDLEM